MSAPGLNPQALFAALIDSGAIDKHDLPRLLGPDRHALTVPRLERAISRASAMRDEDLLAIKSALSGLRPADVSAKVAGDIPAELASSRSGRARRAERAPQ